MKRKNVYALIVITCLITSLLTAIVASNNLEEKEKIALRLKANKNNISLGEPIQLEFEFFNESTTSVRIPTGGVMAGNIEIFIAEKGENYRKYFRSDWGRLDGEVTMVKLEPNQKHKIDNTNATILWNGKPNYSHLNPEAARRADAQDKRILTDYAFPNAGIYLVKVVSCLFDETNRCSIPVESKPVEIKVAEPTGDDLEVWNQIKGNRAIAMLIQRGSFYKEKEAEKEQVINQVEQVVQSYPNSVYSSYLKPNLEKYRENEAKRNEAYKNMRKGQKPQ